jgi:hypothetical protein
MARSDSMLPLVHLTHLGLTDLQPQMSYLKVSLRQTENQLCLSFPSYSTLCLREIEEFCCQLHSFMSNPTLTFLSSQARTCIRSPRTLCEPSSKRFTETTICGSIQKPRPVAITAAWSLNHFIQLRACTLAKLNECLLLLYTTVTPIGPERLELLGSKHYHPMQDAEMAHFSEHTKENDQAMSFIPRSYSCVPLSRIILL